MTRPCAKAPPLAKGNTPDISPLPLRDGARQRLLDRLQHNAKGGIGHAASDTLQRVAQLQPVKGEALEEAQRSPLPIPVVSVPTSRLV